MSYNTKSIIKDASGQAAPQYFNPTTDSYEVATGSYGAIKVKNDGGIDVISNTYSNVALGPSSTDIILDISLPTIIDFLQIFESQDPTQMDVRWIFQIRKQDGSLQNIGSLGANDIAIQRVSNSSHHIFALSKFDSTNGIYSVEMKRQLMCPYGFKLQVQNNSSTSTKSVSAMYIYRQI
jgi:hypothetical protein